MFCQNCGNALVDGAKFCAKCGTQIAANNQFNAAPTTDNSPVIQSTQNEYIQSEYAPQGNVQVQAPMQEQINIIPQEPVAPVIPVAPVTPVEPVTPVYTTPEMAPVASTSPVPSEENMNQMYSQASVQNYENQQTNVNNQQFYATNQQMNVNNQQNFAQNQQYYAENVQGMQPNQMNMQANAPQNWGPMMTPKKSKAPRIILITVISLLLVAGIAVACIFIFGGGKGASTYNDAVTNMVDALAADSSDDILDNMFPPLSDLMNSLKSSDKKSLLKEFIPTDEKFSYSKLEIEFDDAYSKSELQSEKSSAQYGLSAINSLYSSSDKISLDDYDITEFRDFDGTLTIDGEKCYIDGIVVKCDGKWYIYEIDIY